MDVFAIGGLLAETRPALSLSTPAHPPGE